jgi:Fe-S-cluster-containing dehydrogenase component
MKKIKYEKSGGVCVTPCPYNMKTKEFDISREIMVGKWNSCQKCDHHISMDRSNQAVNCSYNDVSLDEDLFKI